MKLRQLIDDIRTIRLLRSMPERIDDSGLSFYPNIRKAFGCWHVGYINDNYSAYLYEFHYPKLKDALRELYKTIKEKQNEE